MSRKPDYVVARTIVIAPPKKPERTPEVEAQVLVSARANYSNLGRNEGSVSGGKRKDQTLTWRMVAAQRLLLETGVSVPAELLIPLGKFENTTKNPDGESFLTLSHAFLAVLSEHPPFVLLDEDQTAMIWLNIISGQLQTTHLNEWGDQVMSVKLAFNTEKMINKAIQAWKKLRADQKQ